MKINKRLLPIKAHYFFLYCGSSPISPFMPVIAKGLGFSAFIVGTVFTIVPLLAFPMKPLMGGIADKFQCQKLMFLSLIIMHAVFYWSTLWLPSLPLATTKLNCYNDSSNVQICSKRLRPDDLHFEKSFNCKVSCEKDLDLGRVIESKTDFNVVLEAKKYEMVDDCLYMNISNVMINRTAFNPKCQNLSKNCKISCENNLLNNILLETSVPDSEVVYYYQFWLLLISVAAAKTAYAVLASTGDSICFYLLGDKPHNFGLQRLWGAFGWGSMSFISGYIVDKLSEGSETKIYSSAYYFLIIFSTLDFLVSFQLSYDIKASAPQSLMKDIYKVINNRHIIIFMIWCTVNGFYTAMVWNYLFWFLEEVAQTNGFDMTYIKTLEGLTLTFHCYLGEIPFFFISSWLIKKIGHVHSMTLVLGTFAVRFIYYSYLTNPWWTLPIEMLNGITFAIFYATMTTYASAFAPTGAGTTVQNLVAALYDALGVSAGTFVGGYMIQTMTSVRTFWILGLSASLFTILHILVQLCIGKPKHISGQPNVDPKSMSEHQLNISTTSIGNQDIRST